MWEFIIGAALGVAAHAGRARLQEAWRWWTSAPQAPQAPSPAPPGPEAEKASVPTPPPSWEELVRDPQIQRQVAVTATQAGPDVIEAWGRAFDEAAREAAQAATKRR